MITSLEYCMPHTAAAHPILHTPFGGGGERCIFFAKPFSNTQPKATEQCRSLVSCSAKNDPRRPHIISVYDRKGKRSGEDGRVAPCRAPCNRPTTTRSFLFKHSSFSHTRMAIAAALVRVRVVPWHDILIITLLLLFRFPPTRPPVTCAAPPLKRE